MVTPEGTAISLLHSLGLADSRAEWHLEREPAAFSNHVWRASAVGAPDCIVKYRGSDDQANPLFGNDSVQEAACGWRLPDALSPALLFHRGDWLVWRYCEGGSVHAPESAAAQLLAVHKTPAWEGLDVVTGAPHGWVEDGIRLLERLPVSRSVYALRERAPRVALAPHSVSLVHRDPHPGNWVGGEKALLADWQSVALGNPMEDFACYLSRGMRLAYGFTPAPLWEASRFLQAAGVELNGVWLDVQAAYEFRFACYCAWRAVTNPRLGHYQDALADYVSEAVPVSKPSIDRPLRSRQ